MKRYAKHPAYDDTVIYARFDDLDEFGELEMIEAALGLIDDGSLQWLSCDPDLAGVVDVPDDIDTDGLGCQLQPTAVFDGVDEPGMLRPGLVLSEQVWSAVGRPPEAVPFTPGYRWVPLHPDSPAAA